MTTASSPLTTSAFHPYDLLLLRRRFRLLRQRRKSRGILHRDIRQHFPVKLHARSLQPVNQLSVCRPVQPSRRANSLNPQPAILPLLHATVALRITIRAIRRLLRRLVQLALCEEKSFCPLKILLPPCPAFCAAFYACHGFFLLIEMQRQTGRVRAEITTQHNG